MIFAIRRVAADTYTKERKALQILQKIFIGDVIWHKKLDGHFINIQIALNCLTELRGK
ncbi:hypothetical protein D3C76_1686660 [compost metagenome]